MMTLTNEQRETLDKYLPWALAALAAWVLARGLRRSFWSLFAMACAVYYTFGQHWFG